MPSTNVITFPSPKEDLSNLWIFRKKHLPKIFGFCPNTIDKWIAQENFPRPDKYIDGKPIWLKSTLEEWAFKREVA